jgi:DNA ligase-1
MLAHTHSVGKYNVAGHYISNKLDGTRCFWDGGLSRGLPTATVPWANIYDPKTGDRKSKIKPVASGLWSRYGNPIMAPDWWLNQLPCMPLDGELWAGCGNFQKCRSICSKDVPVSSEWSAMDYAVFGGPPLASIFMDGKINCPQFRLEIRRSVVENWVMNRLELFPDFKYMPPDVQFEQELALLCANIPSEGQIYLLQQKRIPLIDADQYVEQELEKVLDMGGEGVVIRDPLSSWVPQRSHQLLKYKPYKDAEGIITGFTSGKETERGSKHLGKIGALILNYKDQRLEVSGLTDEEREFVGAGAKGHAREHPGEDMPSWIRSKHFKIGQTITFRYAELTDAKIPRLARYLRHREIDE